MQFLFYFLRTSSVGGARLPMRSDFSFNDVSVPDHGRFLPDITLCRPGGSVGNLETF